MIFLQIIKGVLAFPGAVIELVKLLRKTPQENHEKILKETAEEADKFDKTGRPPT
jgi:hypothetical protein